MPSLSTPMAGTLPTTPHIVSLACFVLVDWLADLPYGLGRLALP